MALTVTATASGAGSSNGILLAVRVVSNAALTQNGATASSETVTTPRVAITPQSSGSWVYGAVGTGASGTAFSSINANTTSVFNGNVVSGDNWGVYRSASGTTTSSTTYGWGAPSEPSGDYYIACAEILSNGSALAEDASTPAIASTAGAKTVTSASFTPPSAAVLVAVAIANWTGSGAVTMTVSDSSGGYTWTQLSGTGSTDLCSVWAGVPNTVSGTAGLFGEGTLSGTGVLAGLAALYGEGTLSAAGVPVVPGAAGLFGEGTLSVPGASVIAPGAGFAGLFGEGTLSGTTSTIWAQAAGLYGEGILSGQGTGLQQDTAGLYGEGTLGFGITLGLPAGLFGAGLMLIPQATGGLVAGTGGAGLPYALPGSSQVAVASPGSGNWQWLGTLGQVTALTYSYVCPGGCDKMTCTVMVPAAYRTQLFNPGWQVKITRGGHDVWHGKLDEPKPSPSGWTLTAAGTGNRGQDFLAYYAAGDTWPASEPDEIVNRAIARGLPWVNPGLNSSPYFSQFWLGQAQDPASVTVSALLNLICTRGGLTWYVNSQPGGTYNGDDLSVFPLPTVPNRLLVCTTPVARTLGADVNYVFIRYESSADTAGTSSASYAYTSAQNSASVTAHGQLETYLDLSDAGVMTQAQAQAVGNYALQVYQRASFAGPFSVSYGQLLNTGGQPVDPGTDQAGTVCRLILTDFGYGGEVTPQSPVTFIAGQYEWDDFAQVATVTPYQTLDSSLSNLLGVPHTLLRAAAGG